MSIEVQDGFTAKMLGGFVIEREGKKLSESANRTRQVWSLLEYLLFNRNSDVSQDTLYQLLWEDEKVDDPANALKNLVYRARVMLRDEFGPDYEFIVFKRNSYCWNMEIKVEIDTDRFDRLVRESELSTDDELKQISLLLQAIEIYKGDFLPKSSMQEWVIPLSTHYHNLYISCVNKVVDLLWSHKRPHDVLDICTKAINIEPYDENLHRNIILAFLALGNSNQALLHYDYVTNLFYRELGVKLSKEIRELYRSIVITEHMMELDLSVIKGDLEEAGEIDGPLLCEYEMFKNIYCLQARNVSRTGESLYLLLVSVCDRDGIVPQVKLLNKAMDKLNLTLKKSLRKNDVVSLFSQSQYVILLQSITFENVERVKNRIDKYFYRIFTATGATLRYSFEPLTPKSSRIVPDLTEPQDIVVNQQG